MLGQRHGTPPAAIESSRRTRVIGTTTSLLAHVDLNAPSATSIAFAGARPSNAPAQRRAPYGASAGAGCWASLNEDSLHGQNSDVAACQRCLGISSIWYQLLPAMTSAYHCSILSGFIVLQSGTRLTSASPSARPRRTSSLPAAHRSSSHTLSAFFREVCVTRAFDKARASVTAFTVPAPVWGRARVAASPIRQTRPRW